MKIPATPALLVALATVFAGAGTVTPARAQSAPVLKEQTPQQADQSRTQDRERAEDVRVGRDWKAQEGANDRATATAADKDHETVGRDWRAHPDNRDR